MHRWGYSSIKAAIQAELPKHNIVYAPRPPREVEISDTNTERVMRDLGFNYACGLLPSVLADDVQGLMDVCDEEYRAEMRRRREREAV